MCWPGMSLADDNAEAHGTRDRISRDESALTGEKTF